MWHGRGVARPEELPLTEWVVLALLDEAPRHGFALARELQASAPVGQVWTVSRPLTYRAVDRLLEKGLIERVRHERSDEGGPNRTIMRPTATGRRRVRAWRLRPVSHLRDLRSEFLVKLVLLDRVGADRRPLVEAQLDVFAPVFDQLAGRRRSPARTDDAVALWRAETAHAARRFLEALLAT
jgi:PadR family transcriptional regulator AphA